MENNPVVPPVEDSRPDFARRAVAFAIDGLIAFVLSLIPIIGGLLGGTYFLVRDGLTLDFANRRSVGKHIMGLKPVRLDGRAMDISTSAARNWMFALGLFISALVFIPIVGWLLIPLVAIIAIVAIVLETFVAYSTEDGRRYGDRFAGTRVIATMVDPTKA